MHTQMLERCNMKRISTLILYTFDFFLHFEVVLKEEHAATLGKATTEHSIVYDALVTHVRPRFVQNDVIGHISGKVDPVWCQKADTAGEERDGQQQKADGACQTHHDLCSLV